MISSEAAHPNCMYMWMDWIISPEANAQVAEWFGEAPSNAKSCDLTSEGHCETFHADDEAYWEDVYYWTTADRGVPRRPHRRARASRTPSGSTPGTSCAADGP